jgi:cytochrome c biogenesis protein CcmG/thiol:disulfide interchange protein DsbE
MRTKAVLAGSVLRYDSAVDVDAPAARSDIRRPTHALRALLWALVAVMTCAWLFLAGGLESIQATLQPLPPAAADPGRPAPDFRLPLASGGEVELSQYRGKVVLLNFWATWCAPCRAEMPAIEKVYQARRHAGFEVLAVDVLEREGPVLAFLSEVGVTFPSAIDAEGHTVRRYRATALPTSILIDRQGIVRQVHVGPLTETMLEQQLADLLP